MPASPRELPLDYERLARFLGALSYPVRLELLHILRFPHFLGEIKLTARRSGGQGTAGSVASRPAVRAHLEKLEEVDLVRSEAMEHESRTGNRFVVNSLKLYAISEELRRLSVIYAGRGATGDATDTLAPAASANPARGPRLVLVHGLYEGKAFSLDPRLQSNRTWVIGRRKGVELRLDYDPYVSMEHAMLQERGGAYTLTDLKGKNGTLVNWAPLPPGGSCELRPADVVGVGRSLLCFAAA